MCFSLTGVCARGSPSIDYPLADSHTRSENQAEHRGTDSHWNPLLCGLRSEHCIQHVAYPIPVYLQPGPYLRVLVPQTIPKRELGICVHSLP